jgi:hypothetical protein
MFSPDIKKSRENNFRTFLGNVTLNQMFCDDKMYAVNY